MSSLELNATDLINNERVSFLKPFISNFNFASLIFLLEIEASAFNEEKMSGTFKTLTLIGEFSSIGFSVVDSV